jgi:D-glycero-alpha-D-manno-heptose-7-phosphate kinase
MRLGNINELLTDHPISTSAPCRIDLGGTLDISSFHYPLRHLSPVTVNLALDMRTTVRLEPGSKDVIRISSAGFDDAAFASGSAPYDHPLGLMFAVADTFGAGGVHIRIHSTSPPRSGLGGSSVAAVALVAALSRAGVTTGNTSFSAEKTALLAHAVEQGVAGVPCGMQDQLAAAFGGVNAWTWPAVPGERPFIRKPLVAASATGRLDRRLLVAYLGVQHVSSDVNGTWIRQFTSGQHRHAWHEIIDLTRAFAQAVSGLDMPTATGAMNRETAIRKTLTPQVLDDMGDALAAAAVKYGCGARFTGAGGGGCMWALGEPDDIAALTPAWQKLLARRPTAGILDCRLDCRGVG